MANIEGTQNVYQYDEQKKKMKVMVFGSGGWIGGYVLKELLKNPSVEIVAILRIGSFPRVQDPRITYISKPSLASIEEKPDAVIYLSWSDLDYYQSPNHLRFAADSYMILKHMVDLGVRNITVTGTCFEYGKKEGQLSEDMPADPMTNYAIGKDALRRMLSSLDIELKWLRLFYLYGEGQRESSLIPRFTKAIADGEQTFEVSGLDKERDYMNVEWAAKAIVKSALQTEVTGIINVCENANIKIEFLLKTVALAKDSKIRLIESSEQFEDHGGHSFWGNNQKLKRIMYGL